MKKAIERLFHVAFLRQAGLIGSVSQIMTTTSWPFRALSQENVFHHLFSAEKRATKVIRNVLPHLYCFIHPFEQILLFNPIMHD